MIYLHERVVCLQLLCDRVGDELSVEISFGRGDGIVVVTRDDSSRVAVEIVMDFLRRVAQNAAVCCSLHTVVYMLFLFSCHHCPPADATTVPADVFRF